MTLHPQPPKRTSYIKIRLLAISIAIPAMLILSAAYLIPLITAPSVALAGPDPECVNSSDCDCKATCVSGVCQGPLCSDPCAECNSTSQMCELPAGAACGADQADSDEDGDGEPDSSDNCPCVANVGQEDCNGNDIGDACDVAADDCNRNYVPDSCEISSLDCNANGRIDACEVLLPHHDMVMREGPLAYWRMNDTGATAADFASASATPSFDSQNGTFVGDVVVGEDGVNSDAGEAVTLDGNGDYVDLDLEIFDKLRILKPKVVTMEAWINNDHLNNDQTIFVSVFKDGSAGTALKIKPALGTIRVFARSSTADSTASTGDASYTTSGEWKHVVGVADFEDNEIRVYMDGVLQTTTAASFGSSVFIWKFSLRSGDMYVAVFIRGYHRRQ